MFKAILGSHVICVQGGLFKQVDVYRRVGCVDNRVYAKWPGGFIRLGQAGATSKPGVSWEDLDALGVDLGTNCKHPSYTL